MKKLFYLPLIALLSACGGAGDPTEQTGDSTATAVIEPPPGFVPIDLNQQGFPIVIYVPPPDSVQGIPEAAIEEIGGGAITVISGKYYQIKIADGTGDLAQRKAEFAVDDVYKYEYVIDEPTLLLYKRQIQNTPMDPEFHFIFVLKAGNHTLEVENVKDGVEDFPQRAAERMIDAMKAAQVKTTS